jgi:branched-chain amino acid transport system ATP-binding protein
MSAAADTALGIRLDGVRAGYGDTVVLEGISLSLPPHGAIAVLGRNGVGKTTLLATIMGHTTLHHGAIRLGEREIATLEPHRRARLGIGWVPQEREIFRSLTVEENLEVAARHGRWPATRVYEFFPSLAARRRHRGNELSGGEQQMLAIGRALAVTERAIVLNRGRNVHESNSLDLLDTPERLTALMGVGVGPRVRPVAWRAS